MTMAVVLDPASSQREDNRPELAPADYCDPVVEAYKKDVDRTLLRENLRLTVEERIRKAQSFHDSVQRWCGLASRQQAVLEPKNHDPGPLPAGGLMRESPVMEMPILIEPLPDRAGFVARLGNPFQLSAEAATREEALQKLALMLCQRLQAGTQVAALPIPQSASLPGSGWMPDDELAREWRDAVQQYRDEYDQADRSRLLDEPGGGEVT
jgi:hypothetical protein